MKALSELNVENSRASTDMFPPPGPPTFPKTFD